MAIYHLTAKTVSMGTGSAKATNEYIEREAKYKKDHAEVLYKKSGNMPEWATEGIVYWKAADLYERGNGRLFKQIEFALPKELKIEEQKELAHKFIDSITTTPKGEKLPYSYAIHKGHDEDNPHCHLMISERALDGYTRTPETWFRRANKKFPEKGGAKKTTEIMPKEWLYSIREQWAFSANYALKKAGHKERIDHRSLQDQGLSREPSRHRGVALNAMLKNGKILQDDIEKDFFKSTFEEELERKKEELKQALALKQQIEKNMGKAREKFLVDKQKKELVEEKNKERHQIVEEKTPQKEQTEKEYGEKLLNKNRGMSR